MHQVPEVGLSEATLESTEGGTIINIWAAGVFVAEPSCILPKGLVLTLSKHVQVVRGVEVISLDHEMVQEGLLQTVKCVDGAEVQPVQPIQGRAVEGGREDEAHAFVI
ncbi:unnamed protein product [Prunus armeniaca]